MIWLTVLTFFWVNLPVEALLPADDQVQYWNFYDRHGELLWTEKPYYNSHAALPKFAESAFMSVEDRNFYIHRGVSARAFLRVLKEFIETGEIQSGGSTITMQLATQLYLPNQQHNWNYKIRQVIYAFILENKFDKAELWEAYAQRINFGNGAIGVWAASQRYFFKDPINLSVGEWAMLVSILPNPSLYNPIRNIDLVLERRAIVLDIWAKAGLLSREEKVFWMNQPLGLNLGEIAEINAPHFIFWIKQNITNNHWEFKDLVIDRIERGSGYVSVHTTLDNAWYKQIRKIVQSEINSNSKHRNLGNESVVVVDNISGEIRVMLGGADYFDDTIDGQVNMATAHRSSGSILKPFLFLLALEQGDSPLQILRDDQVSYFQNQGYYRPRNFESGQTYGAVYFRETLTNSYNLSSVYLLNKIGLAPFMDFLKDGYAIHYRAPEDIGLAAILGGLEVSLLEITLAYSKIATNDTSYKNWITHALSDPVARTRQFSSGTVLDLPFRVAVKTGTSQGFRDNWVVGYTPEMTVGVWAGNNNGAPLHTTSGVEGAGPIWNRVMLHLFQSGSLAGENFSYLGDRSEVRICRSPELKAYDCNENFTAFLTESEFENFNQSVLLKTGMESADNVKILYPSDGEIFRLGTDLFIKTNIGEKLNYSLNGEMSSVPYFENLTSGQYELQVADLQNNILDTVWFKVSN